MVRARATVARIRVRAADERIVPVVALHRVIAPAAADDIVAITARQIIRALTAEAKDEKAATADTSGPEFAAPAAADYSGGATTTTSFDERGDFAPTEPVADPLSTPITPGYDAFPNGTRP